MQEFIEEVHRANGREKAVIYLGDDGLYRVAYEALMEDYVPEIDFRSEYWEPFMRGSVTDTLENARKLAKEFVQPSDQQG